MVKEDDGQEEQSSRLINIKKEDRQEKRQSREAYGNLERAKVKVYLIFSRP